jgi:hypothetical protein
MTARVSPCSTSDANSMVGEEACAARLRMRVARAGGSSSWRVNGSIASALSIRESSDTTRSLLSSEAAIAVNRLMLSSLPTVSPASAAQALLGR